MSRSFRGFDDAPKRTIERGWLPRAHNITNTGTTPIQVYAIYAPAHHKPGKVQATAAAAEAGKDDEPAAWSVQPKCAR